MEETFAYDNMNRLTDITLKWPIVSDLRGNRLVIQDPDAGAVTSVYDDLNRLFSRTDAKVSQSETYCYDDLDRLTSYRVNGINAASFTYYANGNIETNSMVGTYGYSATKPHAVTSISGNTRPIPPSLCEVTYNMRNRPETLYENGYSVTLDYDASGMRRHTQVTNGQTLVREKTRISDFYEEESTPSRSRQLDYIYAEGRIVAVRVGDVQNI